MSAALAANAGSSVSHQDFRPGWAPSLLVGRHLETFPPKGREFSLTILLADEVRAAPKWNLVQQYR